MNHFDVVIVGAGLSGIGAAYHLQTHCPGKTFAILEGRGDVGGTWDLFRYPGIRSDSDMYTLGYSFKPWQNAKAIADGPSILSYVNETADENHLRKHIRFNHMVKSAAWSTADVCWTITAATGEHGDLVEFSCNMLLMCSGYYNYKAGHTPAFTGIEDFQGEVVHPQFWPESLDYAAKRVVVIGSGATAMTLIPAMAEKTASITMLQRSPTYVVSSPAEDRLANITRKYLPDMLAYNLTRFRKTLLQGLLYRRTRKQPEKVKQWLLGMVRESLGDDYDVDTHFTPNYNPWDQRMCLVPDGDLFDAIKSGKATVVTDHVERIRATGITLKSGAELEADIIVTATGLELQLLGGTTFSIDGAPIDFSKTYTYKGMMYSGIPNLLQTFGYVNASWTLRADLNAEYACRLLNHMDATGTRQCTPTLRPEDQQMQSRPWIDDFTSGYMTRALHLFPQQGDHAPWENTQDYKRDKKLIRHAALEDGVLIFSMPLSAGGSVGGSSGGSAQQAKVSADTSSAVS
ncbi:MAG: monooxygenase [Candidatus Azotimanducaceae bacterium]|jgi:monooxygenase